VTIVDVTDKFAPVMLSRTGYEGSAYTHQGWLTEDSRRFLVGDELDELRSGDNTKTESPRRVRRLDFDETYATSLPSRLQ
jgi:hypothetical protein